MKLILSLVAILVSSQAWSACTQEISSVDTYRRELLADLTLAKKYYLESTDPSVVGTFEERSSKLNERVTQKLEFFTNQRSNEYKNIVCSFRAEKTCTNGTHKLKTCDESLVVPAEFSIIEDSIEKTKDGDLKSYNRSGNTFSFSAGRSSPGKANAFVSARARYSDTYVKGKVESELADIKKALNNAGVPTASP